MLIVTSHCDWVQLEAIGPGCCTVRRRATGSRLAHARASGRQDVLLSTGRARAHQSANTDGCQPAAAQGRSTARNVCLELRLFILVLTILF